MRVSYRSADTCPDGAPVYEQGPVRFCCVEMARHWGRLIAFGVPGRASTDRAVNLVSDVPQANGKAVLALVPVDFCPWCGMVIETCRAK